MTLTIRQFREDDLEQVVAILASSFEDDFQKIVPLPAEELPLFLIETGEVSPYPFLGYFVAVHNGEILATMTLRWPKQNRPRPRLHMLKTLRYGWLPTLKLLVMRYIFAEKPAKSACHVAEIAVKANARGRGIGKQLLKFGKELAIERGLTRYTLHVDATNKTALNMYKRFGFKIIKREKSLLARWLLGVKEWYYMSHDIG